MVDKKVLIEQLVAAKVDKKIAATKVDAIIKRVDEVIPNASQEEKDTVILMKIKDFIRAQDLDKFRGTCIAIDEMRDQNQPMRSKADEAYKENSNKAIALGMIKIGENGEKIYLDTREYFDKERKKPNRNYGKPIKVSMRREAMFVIEGKPVRAFGVFDADIGGVYDIYGKINEAGYLNVAKEPSMRSVDKLSDEKLYETVSTVGGESEISVSLADVLGMEKNKPVITGGFIQTMQGTSNGSTMVVLADDEAGDVVAFSATDAVGMALQAIPKGSEVIVVGRTMKSGDRPVGIVITGVVQNPGKSYVRDALSQLDDFEL